MESKPAGAAIPMTNGLYIVTTRWFTAVLVVEGGRVVMRAPALRRRLEFWRAVAVRHGE